MCSHVKKEVVIRTTEHSPFKVCRNTFGSNNLQWSFSIWLSQSLTSLWTNFGPLFFTALLRVIENCGHLFIHVDFKAFWWICWDFIFNTHLLATDQKIYKNLCFYRGAHTCCWSAAFEYPVNLHLHFYPVTSFGSSKIALSFSQDCTEWECAWL